jgi:hypothetical protein
MKDILVCDQEGCNKEAYRVVSRKGDNKGEIFWLCIEHKDALE